MTLLSLAARVEGLSGADREVDALIWLALPEQADCSLVAYSPESHSWRHFGIEDVVSPVCYVSGIIFRRKGRPQSFSAGWPDYTRSLDRAMTMFPPGAIYRSGHSAIAPDPSMFFCDLTLADGRDCHALAHTEAAARVAAALKALAHLPNLKETCDE